MRIKRAPRGVAVAALPALALALCLAACGSSSSPPSSARVASTSTTTTSTTSTTPGRNTAFTACLKQHGVTLPAGRGRFRRGGGGFFGGGGPPGTGTGTTGQGTAPTPPSGQGPPSGGAPNGGGFFRGNSKTAKAFQACAKDLPAGARGGFGPGAGRGFRRPHFSTATLNSFAACVKQHGYTLPKPNTSGNGPIFPRSVESNKQFQAAAKSCESILTSAFRGAPGGAPPGGATGTSTTSGA